MKKYIYLIGVVLGGLMASCASVDLLTYDQLHPAEISFPSNLKQVGVVNNMPYRAAADKNGLTLGVGIGMGPEAAEAVAGTLADSKYFDQVIICDSALQQKNTDLNTDPKLSSQEVDQLTDMLGVDMLVSLERLWVETEKKQVQYPGWEVPFSVIQTKVTPVIRLYLSGRDEPMRTINLTDSIFWEMGAPISEEKVLKEANKLAAYKIASYLAPSWSQTERLYFSGGCVEMRDGAVYLREGSWKEAQNTWKGLYDRLRKGNTKSKSAFNIALSYEMLGNVEEAEKWIQLAQKYVTPNSQEEQIVKAYAKDLSRRKKEVITLNVQMSRFRDNF